MSKAAHRLYIGTMSAIVIGVTIYLAVVGFEYYATPQEDRFYHESHDWFKPSGLFGQGLGVIGTFLMLVGVVIYILRKRYNFMGRFIRLKYLLEFHIFLCTLGPIMILFHTAFKFGGIVSIAFWSMVAIVVSGVVGRFIYIQIPHTIDGRKMSLDEVQKVKTDLALSLENNSRVDQGLVQLITKFSERAANHSSLLRRLLVKREAAQTIRHRLKINGVHPSERTAILSMVREEITLASRIARLESMQQLFKYWHVAHLPFAVIMLVVVVLHVGVAIAFGYTWIF